MAGLVAGVDVGGTFTDLMILDPATGDVPLKQNSFVIRYGQAAKVDVSDFFTKLGYPVTAETKQALKGFPAFTYTPPAPAGK